MTRPHEDRLATGGGAGKVVGWTGTGTAAYVNPSGVADILDLPTAETDPSLVLSPDGAGGVEFRAETGGGFSGTAADVPFVPYSTIAATNVQAAIQEVLDEATGGGSGGAVGLAFQAFPQVIIPGSGPTSSEALATSGGTIVIPIVVPSRMLLRSITIHSRDTANARAAEARLYVLNPSTGDLEFVTGTDATFSFTPSAASDRSATVSGAPVSIAPGTYWLAIRNTSATQTFSIGYTDVNGTHWNQFTLYSTQTLGSALGSTLTQSGWSNGARSHAVRLRSGAFGT